MWFNGSAAPMNRLSPRSSSDGHLWNRGQIYQCMYGGMAALLQVEQEIRPASQRDGRAWQPSSGLHKASEMEAGRTYFCQRFMWVDLFSRTAALFEGLRPTPWRFHAPRPPNQWNLDCTTFELQFPPDMESAQVWT